jgi:long-chain acyl-CoA synthetase
MSDLIRGDDWLRPVHHLPERPFGSGPVERTTIVGALARQARAQPEAPFLTELGERTTFTYAQVHDRVRKWASFLVHRGLQRGERVGVLGGNSVPFVGAVLAVLEAGGVAVPLNPHDPPARTAAQVAFTQARFLLHDAASTATAAACTSVERSWTFPTLDEQASARPGEGGMAESRPKLTDAALIFFTSGTTAAPKAVVQSHYSVAQNAWTLADHHRLGPGVRLLCVLPLHHVNGLEFTGFGALVSGSHTVVSRGFDGLGFWSAVRTHDIHLISLVPNLLGLLADRPGLRGEPIPSLGYAVSAAAPLSVGIARRVWERLGLRIVQGYGLSEVTNFSCLLPTDPSIADYQRWMLGGRKPSIGPALPGQAVEVHDGQGRATPGEEGEIVIRGPCVMSGYLSNEPATEEAFRGGWFHTGDLGYYLLDDHGRAYFHVSGRLREIAKRAGAMVSLLEVDEVLAAMPGAVDAGAAAFANAWVDEEIAAVVVPGPGASLTAEAVAAHCRRTLPFAATPKAIHFVEAVPRTASGKIRRAEITERFSGLRDRLFVEGCPPVEQRASG